MHPGVPTPLLHRRYKAIAAPAHGANDPLALPIVAKRLPYGHDVRVQRRIPHVLRGPQMLQQFLLEHHPVALRDQVRKDLKYLGPQRDQHPSPG